MGRHFVYHLTEDASKRVTRGFQPGTKTARGLLEQIVRDGEMIGGNQKGYFYRQEAMPLSVSFSDVNVEGMGRLVQDRSSYGVALQKSRLQKILVSVQYLSEFQIRYGQFKEEDRWLVDLVRPNDRVEEVYDEFGCLYEEVVAKAYDWSWQKEMRVKCSKLILNGGPSFVFVGSKDDGAFFGGEFGVKPFVVSEYGVRHNEFLGKHGKVPPFEEALGAAWLEVDEEDPIAFMRDVVGLAWDKVYQALKVPLDDAS